MPALRTAVSTDEPDARSSSIWRNKPKISSSEKRLRPIEYSPPDAEILYQNWISYRGEGQYHNIDISDNGRKQNREEKFNRAYVENNASAYRFDQAKLRIGESKGKYEFCDILELNQDNSAAIIHVKKYGGSSSINYLFSQSKFYCESFLSDKTFLSQIRNHIDKSDHKKKAEFLTHIKEEISAVSGNDYEVNMWLLYDNSRKKAPTKSDLPLMTKYELKLAYERLRNINKFKEVTLSMVPVKMVNYSSSKKKDA